MSRKRNNNNFKTSETTTADATEKVGTTTNGGSRSNRNQRRSRNNGSRSKTSKGYVSSENEVRWYSRSPRLLQDAASVPFSWQSGVPFDIRRGGAVLEDTVSKLSPGVCTIAWYPSIGNTNNSNPSTDAVNVAATALFGYITHANSRTTTYDTSDLMLYVLGVSSAYNYFAFLRRVYGKLSGFSALDKNTPRLLVSAMGVNYDDLLRNANTLRLGINVMADRLASLALPQGMSFLERQIWMNESIFTDAESVKPQYYMYVQSAYYKYNEMSGPGRLDLVYPRANATLIGEYSSTYGTYAPSNNNKGLTVSELLDFADELVNPLIASQDINKMSADIIKAMGGNIYKVSMISEDFTVQPTYSKEVLSQFENATCPLPIIAGTGAAPRPVGGVSQNSDIGPSVIRNEVALAVPTPTGYGDGIINKLAKVMPIDAVINMHKDDITPADIMVATRMTCLGAKPYVAPANPAYAHEPTGTIAGEPAGEEWSYLTFTASGSEIILAITVWSNAATPGQFSAMQSTSQFILSGEMLDATADIANMKRAINYLSSFSNFDWHPLVEPIIGYGLHEETASQKFWLPNYVFSDIENYTTVSVEELKRMNDVAILSELYFDGLGDYGLKS